MHKSAKKKQLAAENERAQRELEELRKRLKDETAADMLVLQVLMDAEKQTRGIEQAADDYSVGVEWRLTEAAREIDRDEREKLRRLTAQDAEEAAKEADARIAEMNAGVERQREALKSRFETHRSEYVDRVFNLVIGAENE